MIKKLSFNEQLNRLISDKSSYLCLGLDPDLDKIPPYLKYEKNPIRTFTHEIIEATKDIVVAYKANLAFYECEGQNGLEALNDLATLIPKDVLLILDGKRGDIGNSSRKYAKAYFEHFGADAVTLHPYMGFDSVEPFLQDPGKGSFILTLTSNSGASDIQMLQIGPTPLHLVVAKNVEKWNSNNNCGLVVGAIDVDGLRILRKSIPELPFLIPGIGAQGGDLKEVLKYGRDKHGTGMLINIGRDILYGSQGKNFAQQARKKTLMYSEEMSKLMHTSWDYLK
jgi:orotidine-5'-phosphate decarboxylase